MKMKGRDGELMRTFWDAKARENATYYVSSYRPYHEQDTAQFWEWGDRLAERFLSESGIPFDGTEAMLEIGCGVGRMTRYFARRFREVHGVDVAPEMISRARENLRGLENVTLYVGSGGDLRFLDDRSVDFVFSYITFQHIPKRAITVAYIRETGRVLKPGGHFYFQVNNLPLGFRSRLRLRTRLKSIMGRFSSSDVPPAGAPEGPTGLDHPAWRGSRLSAGRIERACRSAGMEILDLKGEGTQYLWVKAART
jgi:ubiquinone/menaquinone biosynthesis C-methylase UbiE